VTRALAAGRLFCEVAAVPRPATDRLAIVLEEWVMNVVEHGVPHPSSRIVLRLAGGATGVRITVSDAGMAFDPRAVALATPNPDRGGGAGIALILAWATIEDYRRARGRNRLVLALPPR
jgi:serine/threonine-protein kinase RsbW